MLSQSTTYLFKAIMAAMVAHVAMATARTCDEDDIREEFSECDVFNNRRNGKWLLT